MIDLLTIQIPYDLASYAVAQRKKVNKYCTNQVIRALDTWLVLKADAPGSYIQEWNQQKDHLLQICKCSETIFRHRLQVLQDLQLITRDRRHLRLASWDQLGELFTIDISNKLTIQYDINDKQRICEWIIAAEIKDNQSRQAYMILKQVNKIPGMKEVLTAALVKAGADLNQLQTDSGYFLGQLKALYLQDFIQATEIHEILISVRPDTNRGVKKMAATWNAKHPMTVTYWKKILQRSGIIDISKLQVQSNDRVRNKHCRVLWLKKPQETLLCLCDQILVMEPWLIAKNFLPAA